MSKADTLRVTRNQHMRTLPLRAERPRTGIPSSASNPASQGDHIRRRPRRSGAKTIGYESRTFNRIDSEPTQDRSKGTWLGSSPEGRCYPIDFTTFTIWIRVAKQTKIQVGGTGLLLVSPGKHTGVSPVPLRVRNSNPLSNVDGLLGLPQLRQTRYNRWKT